MIATVPTNINAALMILLKTIGRQVSEGTLLITQFPQELACACAGIGPTNKNTKLNNEIIRSSRFNIYVA